MVLNALDVGSQVCSVGLILGGSRNFVEACVPTVTMLNKKELLLVYASQTVVKVVTLNGAWEQHAVMINSGVEGCFTLEAFILHQFRGTNDPLG